MIEGAAEVKVPEDLELLHGEIRNPYFRRTFTLSRELDPTKIEANLKDGVLRLHIPKAEEARPRRMKSRSPETLIGPRACARGLGGNVDLVPRGAGRSRAVGARWRRAG